MLLIRWGFFEKRGRGEEGRRGGKVEREECDYSGDRSIYTYQ